MDVYQQFIIMSIFNAVPVILLVMSVIVEVAIRLNSMSNVASHLVQTVFVKNKNASFPLKHFISLCNRMLFPYKQCFIPFHIFSDDIQIIPITPNAKGVFVNCMVFIIRLSDERPLHRLYSIVL